MAVSIILGAIIIAIGAVLMTGHGAMLIAGYNTMPERKRARYNSKELSRFVGKIILPIGIMTLILAFYNPNWFVWAYAAVTATLIIFAAVYANTGERFMK